MLRLGSGFDNVVKLENTEIHMLPPSFQSLFFTFLQFNQILVWTIPLCDMIVPIGFYILLRNELRYPQEIP